MLNPTISRRKLIAGAIACGEAFGQSPAKLADAVAGDSGFLAYPLKDGWVDHWLLAGPQVIVIPDGDYQTNPASRIATAKKFATKEPLAKPPFVEDAAFELDGEKISWRHYACKDDHLVDLAAWFGSSRYLRVWAYVELMSDKDGQVSFQMFTNGPGDVWIDEIHAVRTEEFDLVNARPTQFTASLRKGWNRVLVRFEHVLGLHGLIGLALRLDGVSAGAVSVRIPVAPEDVTRRQALESAFESVYLTRDTYRPGEEIIVRLPHLASGCGPVPIELRSAQQVVKRAAWDTGEAADQISLVRADPESRGYSVVLAAGHNRRELGFRVHSSTWHSKPRPGTIFAARRREVLEAAANQAGPAWDPQSKTRVNLWNSWALRGEIAKMELGRWSEFHPTTIGGFVEAISRVEDGADFRILEVLGMFTRYGKRAQFPSELAGPIERCLLGFRYWADEPGITSANYFTENHRFAFHASEILAGQLFPSQPFLNNGQTGAWHREHGEKLALDWMHKRGSYGFEEWDSNGYMAADCNILVHLAEMAQNAAVKTLARTVLDKILFSIALNSYQGSFGSTHGRTSVDYIKNGRNEPVACISYLGWGLGGINQHAEEAVLLACAGYEVPPVIQEIALDQPQALWSRDRQGLDPRIHGNEAGGPVDKVTFKTPDFMLCSAQNWKPGKAGYQQHIWQATMGPDAVVFGTHPACISENGNRRPNFWAGNHELPRVAQWKDTLVSVHQLSDKAWLDFTHAWFPMFAFDESVLEGGWAFARKGNGYVALTAARGMSIVTRGDSAQRELRSTGRQNVWLCQMGRTAVDGDFTRFRRKVLALPLRFDDLAIRFTTPRGETLEFGWTGPLRVDRKEQPIDGFKHFESSYCTAPWPAPGMVIRQGGKSLALDFTIGS